MTWLEGRCHSYGGLPGWPFVEMLLGWLGAEIGEPEIAIRTKARAGLGALFGGEADAVLGPLAGLLRLRIEASPATEEESDGAFVRWLETPRGPGPSSSRSRTHSGRTRRRAGSQSASSS